MNGFNELRFVFRILRKSSGFTLMAVLMLALGIGATTAVFSIVEGVLLLPLPFPDSGRLVALFDVFQGSKRNNSGGSVTGPEVLAQIRNTRSFESIGGYTQATSELSGVGEPAIIHATRFTGGVFPTLGVPPLMGRVFTQEEDDQKQQVAVLNYAAWRERFQGNPQVLGRKILLDRRPYVIIGVMPRGFEFPLIAGQLTRSDLWVPMSFAHEEISGGSSASWHFQMVARLKRGVSSLEAQSEADRVAQDTMHSALSFLSSLHVNALVLPLHETTVEQARPMVRVLFLSVIVVLLIACANLAGLLLIRAIRRRRELAIRLALGARAFSLIRQAVMEGLMLSVMGGSLGLICAEVALRFGRNLLPRSLPLANQIGLDWRVVLFAITIALFTGVVCAIAPAVAAVGTNTNDSLKESGRTGTESKGHARLRSLLVVAEIAIAMVLLSASGLLLRSFNKMQAVDLGFRPDHTLTAAYALPRNQYGSQGLVNQFNKEVLDRQRHLPGVAAASLISILPESGLSSGGAFVVDGYVPSRSSGLILAWPSSVMGDYFRAMGIGFIRGRDFTEEDKADKQLVAVVNRKLCEHYWPGQDPIGKRLRWGLPESPTPWMMVVGEVEDVKQTSPDQETREQIYQPVDQLLASYGSLADSSSDLAGDSGFIVLRSTIPPEQMQHLMISAVHSVDPQLPLTHVRTMEDVVSDTEAPRRFNTAVIAAFAAAAVLLALLGVYSVIAFSVALRHEEMAIRMALGSTRRTIAALILAAGTKLAAAGCALGLIGTLFTSRLVRTFLFDVSPFDPVVLAGAAICVLLLTMAILVAPAWQAASIDPIRALRAE